MGTVLLCLTFRLQTISETRQIPLEQFSKISGGHKSFLWGHWYPCFGFLVMSALGFKARVDFLTCLVHHLCTTDSSDSPVVQYLLTSWWLVWEPSCFIHVLAYRHWWGSESRIKCAMLPHGMWQDRPTLHTSWTAYFLDYLKKILKVNCEKILCLYTLEMRLHKYIVIKYVLPQLEQLIIPV